LDSIRDVMIDAPARVEKEQLDELGINLILKELV
jgi:aspartyl-tRNA synthetase